MSGGTVNISRAIFDHEAFRKEPYTEPQAFIWLIMEASWKARTVRFGDYVVDLRWGELAASVRYVGEAWDWDKSRVSRFLKRLQNRDMIETDTETHVLRIKVKKYDTYQGVSAASETGDRPKARQDRDTCETKENPRGKKQHSPAHAPQSLEPALVAPPAEAAAMPQRDPEPEEVLEPVPVKGMEAGSTTRTPFVPQIVRGTPKAPHEAVTALSMAVEAMGTPMGSQAWGLRNAVIEEQIVKRWQDDLGLTAEEIASVIAAKTAQNRAKPRKAGEPPWTALDTTYLEAAMRHLERQGRPVPPDMLQHLAPLG